MVAPHDKTSHTTPSLTSSIPTQPTTWSRIVKNFWLVSHLTFKSAGHMLLSAVTARFYPMRWELIKDFRRKCKKTRHRPRKKASFMSFLFSIINRDRFNPIWSWTRGGDLKKNTSKKKRKKSRFQPRKRPRKRSRIKESF